MFPSHIIGLERKELNFDVFLMHPRFEFRVAGSFSELFSESKSGKELGKCRRTLHSVHQNCEVNL